MSDRFGSRADLAAKIEWEGGLLEALDYGIKTEDMPEGDSELEDAWGRMAVSFAETRRLADAVEKLLPEPGAEDDGEADQ